MLRLRGGKGGFGSLLRGAGKQKLTDNFDACRDLQGAMQGGWQWQGLAVEQGAGPLLRLLAALPCSGLPHCTIAQGTLCRSAELATLLPAGRRIRHKTAAKKLAEWQAEAKERELEKVAQRHMKELAKKQKQEERQHVSGWGWEAWGWAVQGVLGRCAPSFFGAAQNSSGLHSQQAAVQVSSHRCLRPSLPASRNPAHTQPFPMASRWMCMRCGRSTSRT